MPRLSKLISLFAMEVATSGCSSSERAENLYTNTYDADELGDLQRTNEGAPGNDSAHECNAVNSGLGC